MPFQFSRFGNLRVNVMATGVTPTRQEVIAAQTGFRNSILAIEAANQTGANAITFYEGETKLTPTVYIPGSGTLFNDDFGGAQYELATGSGLNVSLESTGQIDVLVFYLLHDESAPITKSTARANTLSNITTSRAGG